jgi:hypothetical protein
MWMVFEHGLTHILISRSTPARKVGDSPSLWAGHSPTSVKVLAGISDVILAPRITAAVYSFEISSGFGRLAQWIMLGAASALGSPAASVSTGAEISASGHVTFLARDFEFSGPEKLTAGMTEVTLLNQGQDLHQLQFIKLPDGKTAGQFKAAIEADPTRLPRWAIRMGGPNAVIPGAQAVAILDLPPGRYVLLCGIPDARGIPHAGLGMLKPLSIAPGEPQSFEAPPGEVSITAADFGYTLSQSLTAGKKTIQMVNKGSQAHEVVVVELAPGARIKDYAEAFQPGVPVSPAGKPIGGMVGLEARGEGRFSLDLAPGQYGLICFLPDIRGAPHFTRGMMMDVTVN